MKKKIIISSLVVISIALSVGVFRYRSGSSNPAPSDIWVQAVKVKETSLPLTVNAIGTLVARNVQITPEMAGHVRKIYFRDGAAVKQDTPLIQLDDAIYKAKYESANAQLAYSRNDYQRKSLLGKQGAIAQQAIDQADADLKEKGAVAKESRVMMDKMLLAAPFEGVVGKSKVNPGDYVTTGQSLVTLTDTKHLRIEYNVPEKYLPLLHVGQEVKVTTATWPLKAFIGKVAFISPTISPENRSVAIYAEIDNEQNELAPGMFVNVSQALGTEEHVIMVPARSIVPMLDSQQVYKVVNGKAYGVNVTTGKHRNETVQITQGLSLGDMVITDGQLKVKNGVPVHVKG
jgi:membrane fusion protein (multidrug efflux system)